MGNFGGVEALARGRARLRPIARAHAAAAIGAPLRKPRIAIVAGISDAEGRRRAVIGKVTPSVDGGRFPIKRCAGDQVVVEADVFADGHDQLRCRLLHRRRERSIVERGRDDRARQRPLAGGVHRCRDRSATNTPSRRGWIATCRGATIWSAGRRPRTSRSRWQPGPGSSKPPPRARSGPDGQRLRAWAKELTGAGTPGTRRERALDAGFERAHRALSRPQPANRERAGVPGDGRRRRVRASAAGTRCFPALRPARVTARSRIARPASPTSRSMGFDVLYFPPIHPIGVTRRKGRNNATTASPGEPGSPWAIGSREGGHKAIHPELGTAEDFRRLVALRARAGHRDRARHRVSSARRTIRT